MKNLIAPLALLITLLLAVVFGEVSYHSQIHPGGVRTLAQHLQRFGNPRLIYRVSHKDGEFYELQGFPGGSPPWLAFPSAAPVYIYDGNGQLVDWCTDPGDNSSHRARWPRISNTPVELNEFRKRFQLEARITVGA